MLELLFVFFHGRYPWESGSSGIEVTPDGVCPACVDRQIHINGAIAFAIRQYFSLTRDNGFLNDRYYQVSDFPFYLLLLSPSTFLLF